MGDSFEKVDKYLKKHGYRCYDSGVGYYEYERSRINISLYVTRIENEVIGIENISRKKGGGVLGGIDMYR